MPTMKRDVERLNTTGRGFWLGLNGAAPYGPLMDTLTSLINRLANRIIGAPGRASATPASKVKTAAAIHCVIDDAADQWLLAHGHKAKRGAPDMGHLWEAPNELVWPYAGTDSVVGAILDDLLDAPLDAANLRTVYDNERIPMAVDYAVHDREGLRVTPMKLEQFSRDLAVARDLINARLTQLVGHELNINSPKQIQKYLYEDQQYPIIAYTDMGQPSTREEYLLELARMIDDPVIHLILHGRGHAKLDGTYVTGKEGRPG